MSTPLISVIIPVWNGAHEIGTCLAALARQRIAPGTFEVIVVDNGSTDGTPEIVGDNDDVMLLHEPVASSYRARNRGIAAARGSHLLFTDADCTPAPDWIAAAVTAIRDGKHDLYGGCILIQPTAGGDRACADYDQLFALDQRRNVLGAGKAVTANFLTSAAVAGDLGGFDSALMSGGDVDFCRRARARGYTLGYREDMTVAHPARGSVAALAGKQRRIVGGRMKRDGVRGAAATGRALLTFSIEHAAFLKRAALASLPWRRRVRVGAIVGRLWLASISEGVRVAAGGAPRRS